MSSNLSGNFNIRHANLADFHENLVKSDDIIRPKPLRPFDMKRSGMSSPDSPKYFPNELIGQFKNNDSDSRPIGSLHYSPQNKPLPPRPLNSHTSFNNLPQKLQYVPASNNYSPQPHHSYNNSQLLKQGDKVSENNMKGQRSTPNLQFVADPKRLFLSPQPQPSHTDAQNHYYADLLPRPHPNPTEWKSIENLHKNTHLSPHYFNTDKKDHYNPHPQSFNMDKNTPYSPQSYNEDKNSHFSPQSYNMDKKDHFSPQSYIIDKISHFSPQSFNMDKKDHFSPQSFKMGKNDLFTPQNTKFSPLSSPADYSELNSVSPYYDHIRSPTEELNRTRGDSPTYVPPNRDLRQLSPRNDFINSPHGLEEGRYVNYSEDYMSMDLRDKREITSSSSIKSKLVGSPALKHKSRRRNILQHLTLEEMQSLSITNGTNTGTGGSSSSEASSGHASMSDSQTSASPPADYSKLTYKSALNSVPEDELRGNCTKARLSYKSVPNLVQHLELKTRDNDEHKTGDYYKSGGNLSHNSSVPKMVPDDSRQSRFDSVLSSVSRDHNKSGGNISHKSCVPKLVPSDLSHSKFDSMQNSVPRDYYKSGENISHKSCVPKLVPGSVQNSVPSEDLRENCIKPVQNDSLYKDEVKESSFKSVPVEKMGLRYEPVPNSSKSPYFELVHSQIEDEEPCKLSHDFNERGLSIKELIKSAPMDKEGREEKGHRGHLSSSERKKNKSQIRDTLLFSNNSSSGLDDIKKAIEELTLRSSHSNSTYSSVSETECEKHKLPSHLLRHSSLDTINTMATSADEFVWVDSHHRLVELSSVPWSSSDILKVIELSPKLRSYLPSISMETVLRLSYILTRPLVRIALEAQRLASPLGFCSKGEISSAFRIVLPQSIAEGCVRSGLRAGAMFALGTNEVGMRESKGGRSGLGLQVGRVHAWMIEMRLGAFVHEFAAVQLCAGIENLIEEILSIGLLSLSNEGEEVLTSASLEHSISSNGELWGICQPTAHLSGGRSGSGALVLPRWASSLSMDSGGSNSTLVIESEYGNSKGKNLEQILLTTCVGSIGELSELVVKVSSYYQKQSTSLGAGSNKSINNVLSWSSVATQTLYYFMRCSQLESAHDSHLGVGSSKRVELVHERPFLSLPPLSEWVRVGNAHAEHRHSHLVEKDDVLQAARLLLPGMDCPVRSFCESEFSWPKSPSDELETSRRLKTELGFRMLSSGRTDLVQSALLLLPLTRANTFNEFGLSPIMLAAIRGEEGMVKCLIESGGNVDLESGCNCKNYPMANNEIQGWTALTFASLAGHYNIVKLLLERGSDVEGGGGKCSDDKSTQTPLQVSVAAGHSQLTTLLLNYGANPFLSTLPKDSLCFIGAASRGSYSAISLAASHGRRLILHKLLSHPIPAAPSSLEVLSLQEILAEGVDSKKTHKNNSHSSQNNSHFSHQNSSNNSHSPHNLTNSSRHNMSHLSYNSSTNSNLLNNSQTNSQFSNNSHITSQFSNNTQSNSHISNNSQNNSQNASNYPNNSSNTSNFPNNSQNNSHFSKSQLKTLQEALYQSSENGHIDICMDLRRIGVGWSVHTWASVLATAHERKAENIIGTLLGDFNRNLAHEDLSSGPFVQESLPLLFNIFRGTKGKTETPLTLLLAQIFSSIYSPDPIKEIKESPVPPATRIDPKYVNNPDLSDVQFRVEGKIFYAHKIVLVTASPKFKTMLGTGTELGDPPVIQINDIRYDIFKMLIEFLYNGTCLSLTSDLVQIEEVLELMAAASFFSLDALLLATQSKLASLLTPHSVVSLYIHAKVYHGVYLLEYCQAYILQNMVELLNMDHSLKRLLFGRRLANHDVLAGLLLTLQERVKNRGKNSVKSMCKANSVQALHTPEHKK